LSGRCRLDRRHARRVRADRPRDQHRPPSGAVGSGPPRRPAVVPERRGLLDAADRHRLRRSAAVRAGRVALRHPHLVCDDPALAGAGGLVRPLSGVAEV